MQIKNSSSIYETFIAWIQFWAKNKLLKNRNLYVIKLDPKNISEIKSYNKDHAYDDFTLECTAGTGRECISSFLKSYLVSGTCANATKDTFYSCVYD